MLDVAILKATLSGTAAQRRWDATDTWNRHLIECRDLRLHHCGRYVHSQHVIVSLLKYHHCDSGGTAGSVLASRLSEEIGVTVLLIDRGGVDDTWQARVPMMSLNTFRADGPARRWFAQPLVEANDRSLEVLYGEGLGGTSRINGMVYTRGV